MSINNYINQTLLGSLGVINKSLIRFYLIIVFASGLLIISPAMGATTLEFNQPNFTGVFGVDYPVLDFVADLDDGDTSTTDYFFEWTLISYDSLGDPVEGFTCSVFDCWTGRTTPHQLFPSAGDYTFFFQMATFHQMGGLPECPAYSDCFDFQTPFTELFASDIMSVQLVPIPAAVWLFGSGLIGLIGVARRKKS